MNATIAAQLATLPILMVGFHQVSLVAPLANLLCLPALPWIMALGALAEVVAWVNVGLGSAVAWLVWAPLTWMIWVVHALAALPFAYRPASGQGSLYTSAYYVLLIGALALAPRPRLEPARSTSSDSATAVVPSAGWHRLLVPGVVAVAAVATIVAALPRDPLMHVVVLDVGKGDAALVTDPSGRRILIDTGSSPRTLALRLGALLPPWTRRLDLLVLSSYDQDELQGAIEVAARYRPRAALTPAGRGSGALYEQWTAGAAQAGVDVQPVTDPVSLVLAGNSRLEARPIRRTGTAAAKGPRLAVRLVNGDFAAVFGGNLDVIDQQQLVDDGAPLGATLLVIPHNGTPGSVAPPFLRAVAPAGVAIAVDPAGKSDSPSGDTLDQLAGVSVYRTDELGTLDIITDGHGWALRR